MHKRLRPEDWLWVALMEGRTGEGRLVLVGRDLGKTSTTWYRRLRLWGDAHQGIPARVEEIITILQLTLPDPNQRRFGGQVLHMFVTAVGSAEYALTDELLAIEEAVWNG